MDLSCIGNRHKLHPHRYTQRIRWEREEEHEGNSSYWKYGGSLDMDMDKLLSRLASLMGCSRFWMEIYAVLDAKIKKPYLYLGLVHFTYTILNAFCLFGIFQIQLAPQNHLSLWLLLFLAYILRSALRNESCIASKSYHCRAVQNFISLLSLT